MCHALETARSLDISLTEFKLNRMQVTRSMQKK